MSRLLKELLISLDDSHIRIECDNKQTIRLVIEEVAQIQAKLRHVDIHNHWLRQEVQQGLLTVEYTESARMIAEKALTNNALDKFMKQMNLKDVDDLLTERRQELKELDMEILNTYEDDFDCPFDK